MSPRQVDSGLHVLVIHRRDATEGYAAYLTSEGFRVSDRMMVDRLTAVPRRRLGRLVGSLASEEVKALNRAIFVFLGLAETEASQE